MHKLAVLLFLDYRERMTISERMRELLQWMCEWKPIYPGSPPNDEVGYGMLNPAVLKEYNGIRVTQKVHDIVEQLK